MPPRSLTLVFVLAAAFMWAKPNPALAALDLALSGRAGPLVACGQSVIVGQAGTLVWLSSDGTQRIRRAMAAAMFGSTAARMQSSPQPSGADEALFDRHGVEEDMRREIEGERWLEEMRPLRQPSRLPPTTWASDERLPLLASNTHTAFAASDSGLFHLPAPGLLKPVLAWGRKPLALAVSQAGRVAFVAGAGISALDPNAGGASFVCSSRPVGAVDQLVALDLLDPPPASGDACAGTILLWRQERMVMVASKGGNKSLPVRAWSLVSCGNDALINASEGIFLLRPSRQGELGSALRIAAPAPQQQVRCKAGDPGALLSFSHEGEGASTSVDGGRTWKPVSGLAGASLLDAVLTDEAAWLAAPGGLWRLGPEAADRAFAAPAEPRAPRRQAPAAWLGWLPTIDVMGRWGRRQLRHDPAAGGQATSQLVETSVWLTAEFPLAARPVAPWSGLPQLAPSWDVSLANFVEISPGGGSGKPQASQPAPTAGVPEAVGSNMPPSQAAAPPPPGPPVCLNELRDAAVATAMAEPERLRSLVSRARHAAWLPELRFRVEKRLGRNQALELEEDTAFAPLGIRTVDDLRLEVRASWDLSRVVYNADELAATVQAGRMAEIRREVAALVNRLFFERRRREEAEREAQLGMDAHLDAPEEPRESDLPPTRRQRLRSTTNLQRLRTAEISADLDALTNGLAATCR